MSSVVTSRNNKPSESAAWKYFDVYDPKDKTAKCRICENSKIFSYKTTVTNLLRHVRAMHPLKYVEKDTSDTSADTTPSVSDNEEEQKDCQEDDDGGTKHKNAKAELESLMDTLEVKSEQESVCLLCHETFAEHDSSVMMDHMVKVHNISQIKLVDGTNHFEQAENQNTTDRKPGKRSCCWQYFTAVHGSDFKAVCNFCNNEFSYKTTVSNLTKHLIRKHRVDPSKHGSQSDGGVATQNSDPLTVKTVKGVKSRSVISSFYKFVNDEKTVCACIYCKAEYNVGGDGTSDMRKHLVEKHPEALLHHKLSDDPLFLSNTDEDNEESGDENFYEEYLESEIYDDVEKVKRTGSTDNARRNSVNRRISLDRKISKERRTSMDRRASGERTPKIARINYNHSNNQNKDSVLTSPKVPDSLEHFSKYVISLLQELPDKVSKKLQMNFVKQIIEAQIVCAEETVSKINHTVPGAVSTGDITVTVDEPVNDTTSSEANTEIGHTVTIANGIILRHIVTSSSNYDLSHDIK